MESKARDRAIYEFGDIVLDPQERKLSVRGEEIHLPAKEFDTLVFLVEHNGKALSKEEMISAVWEDAFVEEGNLAKQISRLRKTISSSGVEYIETLPKHGYRFKADVRLLDDGEPTILEKRIVKRMTLEFDGEAKSAMQLAARESFFTLPRIAALAFIAAAGIATIIFATQRSAPAAKIESIAVLPLRPLNEDQSGKELGLGIADALITKVGSLRRVIVRPTGAVAAFSAQTDPIDAAKKLRVDAVLEGTIQQSGDRLRINARLLRTSTGEQIWADKFDQPSTNLFALQDALSSSIARALAFELSMSDNEELLRRGTQNAEAYEKYLRGRFYLSQTTPDGLNKSIDLFEQALSLDPNFAEAYAGIADANVILFNFGISGADATIPKARHAIARAMQLNSELSNVHTSHALIQFLIDKNWPAAEKSLQRAIELNGNNADAFLRYGYFLINAGRFDDALDKLSKTRELNPLSPIAHTNIGMAYLFARRYPQAIEQLKKTAADNPRFSLPQWLLATAYEESGDGEQSFVENVKALEIEGGQVFAAELKRISNEQGTAAANRFWFTESVAAKTTGSVPSINEKEPLRIPALIVALRAATAKDYEQTLFWIEKAFDEDDPTLVQIKYLSKFDFVRNDPRFHEMVYKLAY